MAVTTRRAVFVDQDGTLVENLAYDVDPGLLSFTRGAIEGLRQLSDAGYLIFVVTNQPGAALGHFDQAALDRLEQGLRNRLAAHGVPLASFYACPGLLERAAHEHDIDLTHSWMVGDILDDVEAGRRAGCRTVMLDVGHETEWLVNAQRTPHFAVADLREAATVILDEDGVTQAFANERTHHDQA